MVPIWKLFIFPGAYRYHLRHFLCNIYGKVRSNMIKHLSKQDLFEEEVKGSLVLVDFFATWCGPCSMLSPVIEELDKQVEIKVIKVDVDEFPGVAQKFRVMSIPTLVLFKDGKPVNVATPTKEDSSAIVAGPSRKWRVDSGGRMG